MVKKIKQEKYVGNHPDHKVVNIEESLQEKGPSKEMIKAVLAFSAGTAGRSFFKQSHSYILFKDSLLK